MTIEPWEVADRVARGAKIMEIARPGSVAALDLERLEVESIFYCPLGQTFGSFGTGLDALVAGGLLDNSTAAAVDHGFDSLDGVVDGLVSGEYDALDEAWRQEVLRRRAESP